MLCCSKLHALFDYKTEEEWKDAIFNIAIEKGFSYLLFVLLINKNTAIENRFLISNFPKNWIEVYNKNQLHKLDPVVSHCKNSTIPITWQLEPPIDPNANEFYKQISGFGIESGVSFPLHRSSGEYGVLTFANGHKNLESGVENETTVESLSLVRDFILESSLKFLNKNHVTKNVKLTSRETECIKWIMAGKSSWEISQILYCSEATINFHVANLKKKFGVQNRQQTVIKAIQFGLISPENLR